MTSKSLSSLLGIYLILSSIAILTSTATQAQNRLSFFCGNYQGYPATIARHSTRGNIVLISWRSDHFGDNYSPQTRCQQFSARLDRAYQEGNLNYILPGKYNNQAVLCASQNPPRYPLINCPSNRVLLTLSPKPEYPTISALANAAVRELAKFNMNISNPGSSGWKETNPLDEADNGAIGINVNRMILGGVNTGE